VILWDISGLANIVPGFYSITRRNESSGPPLLSAEESRMGFDFACIGGAICSTIEVVNIMFLVRFDTSSQNSY